jgi:hypothetical protein
VRKFNLCLVTERQPIYTLSAMSKRKVNFGAITSEAARRQLMVPTPCWERVSVTPEDAAPSATWKVYKWVKTDRKQARPFLALLHFRSRAELYGILK